MRSIFKNKDYVILIPAIILSIIGIVGIYSAGLNSTSSSDEYIKQIIWFGISLVVMFVVWILDYHVSSIFRLISQFC